MEEFAAHGIGSWGGETAEIGETKGREGTSNGSAPELRDKIDIAMEGNAVEKNPIEAESRKDKIDFAMEEVAAHGIGSWGGGDSGDRRHERTGRNKQGQLTRTT